MKRRHRLVQRRLWLLLAPALVLLLVLALLVRGH